MYTVTSDYWITIDKTSKSWNDSINPRKFYSEIIKREHPSKFTGFKNLAKYNSVYVTLKEDEHHTHNPQESLIQGGIC